MKIGNELLGKLRKMRMLSDDDDDAAASGSGQSKGQTPQQPAWMRQLHERCKEWLEQLPSVSFYVASSQHLSLNCDRARHSTLLRSRLVIIRILYIAYSTAKVQLVANSSLKSEGISQMSSRFAKAL